VANNERTEDMKIAPTPWGRDKYVSIVDATGERVELTGIAMATGRISDDALCHGNSALLLAAPKMADVLRAIVRSAELNQAAVNTFLLIDAREVLAMLDGVEMLAAPVLGAA
jgi:hypothetical protein